MSKGRNIFKKMKPFTYIENLSNVDEDYYI